MFRRWLAIGADRDPSPSRRFEVKCFKSAAQKGVRFPLGRANGSRIFFVLNVANRTFESARVVLHSRCAPAGSSAPPASYRRSASAAQLQESSFGPKVDDANSSAARPFAVSIIRCRPCSLAADESVIRAPVPVYSDWGRTFLKSCLRLWLRSGIDRQIRRRRYFRSCATPRDSAFAEVRHNRKSPAIADGAFNRSDAAAYLRVAHIYMLISMPTDTSTTFGAFQAIWALP